MTHETLIFFKTLLDAVTVSVGHPQFDAQVQQVIAAKAALDVALAEADPDVR